MDIAKYGGRNEVPPQAEKLWTLVPAGSGESVFSKSMTFGRLTKDRERGWGARENKYCGYEEGVIWEEFGTVNIIKMYCMKFSKNR